MDMDPSPWREPPFWVLLIAFGILVAFIVLTFNGRAHAHQAPTGWTYSSNCCGGQDCAQAEDGQVRERPEGYFVSIEPGHHPQVKEVPFRAVVPYDDVRIRNSPDGYFHVCLSAGYRMDDEGWNQRLFCLYVPPRSF